MFLDSLTGYIFCYFATFYYFNKNISERYRRLPLGDEYQR